ncbi:MAG: FHA domain-containing protein [Acidimicrobiales bacterium]
MPESLLTIGKFCLLGLVYLFFFRVLRAVWVEISGRQPEAGPAPVARPASSGRGVSRLRIVEPAEARGRSFDLGDELTVGRAGGCQITLDDTFASQLHARLFRRDGQVWVEDLGSTNGTYLNQQKVTAPVNMRKGDRLQVGKTVMELS